MRFKLTIDGTAPLLMHNARLANPLDPIVQAKKPIAAKRSKTDDDLELLSRYEFLGGLYADPDIGPYIPAENIERCIRDAAAMTRNGRNVQRGLFIETPVNPIAYDGPRDPEKMWEDGRFTFTTTIKNSGPSAGRVARTRPIFHDWSLECVGVADENMVDIRSLREYVDKAGQYIGLCDWRPRYGRFKANVQEVA